MNKQSQWLFEAPPVLEATHYSNPHANPELEHEWELQETNSYGLGEEEWEMRPKSKILISQRKIPPHPFLTSRLKPRYSTTSQMLHEDSNQTPWYFIDVWWLDPSNNQYVLLEASPKPFQDTRSRVESITDVMCRNWKNKQGGRILCRCLVWSSVSKQWLLCQNTTIGR
ncbi:MAG: hypothetical protein V7L22_00005 [Nostoc sp.]|uniref:hypothetical protein n=1 Tax=Nostoc sp. TaxID=1180 RepID=UPI002FF613D7